MTRPLERAPVGSFSTTICGGGGDSSRRARLLRSSGSGPSPNAAASVRVVPGPPYHHPPRPRLTHALTRSFPPSAGSQLESNAKAMNIQCKVCMQTFLCTMTEAKLKEHSDNKHPKNDFYQCFPHLKA